MSASLHFLTEQEWRVIEDSRRAGFPDNCAMKDFFLPGMAWLCPWYFDPENPRKSYSKKVTEVNDNKALVRYYKERGAAGKSFLSVHYWRDWAEIRPPIMVVCPNGEQWCIDQGSSNGNGWRVTGEWDAVNRRLNNITAMPSIIVPGFHGWLKEGKFSADLEGRGPNGIFIPYAEREK